jgi:hypothetical protein
LAMLRLELDLLVFGLMVGYDASEPR